MKKLTPFKIVAIYISAYILWIVGTDIIVTNITMPDEIRMNINITKGIFSVLISSIFLYWIIYRYTVQLKQADRSLLEEKMKFESIVSSIGDGISFVDTNYKIMYQNSVHIGALGNHTGEYCHKAYHYKTEVCEGCPVAMSYADGGIHRTERLVEGDGNKRYFEVTAAPVKNTSGNIVGAVEVVREITKRKKMEKAVIESEQHYKMLFEASPISIWQEDLTAAKKELDVITARGVADLSDYFKNNPDDKLKVVENIKVLDINEASLRLFKAKTKTDLTGYLKPCLTTEAIDAIVNGLCFLYKGNKTYEAEYRLKSLEGDYLHLYHRWLVINGNENSWGNVLVSRIDLTNLKKSEEFVKDILHSVDEGFIVVDRNLQILSANPAFLRMAGRTDSEVVGNKCHEVSHKNAKPCFESGEDCPVQKTFATGKSYTATHIHKHDDGSSLVSEIKSHPMQDISGEVVSVIETIVDITEKMKLEEELSKTQKLESIGLLAGGIAHDFNNLLTGIQGYISLIKMKSEINVQSYVEEAEKAVELAKSLTQQLLTLSKGGEPIKKAIHILPTVKDAVGLGLSETKIRFDIAFDENLPVIEADAGQIKQVVQNMVINASEAMPQGGNVSVNVKSVRMKEDRPALKHGTYIAIIIKDTGIGIAKDHLSSIFDPYFTTKQKGSGLGLATSFAIVKKHGGTINVDSEVGKGSTFTVLLPVSDKSVLNSELKEKIITGQGKILLLEDEPLVTAVCRDMLTALGYEVEFTATGEETVKKYVKAIQSAKPYDLVILDLTIRGGMGGQETMQKLLKINPNVKAVVSSGYTEDAIMAHYEDYGFKAALTKPFKIEEMSRVLRKTV